MSEQEKTELTNWHESRMKELGYPERIINELRTSRVKWLASVKEMK